MLADTWDRNVRKYSLLPGCGDGIMPCTVLHGTDSIRLCMLACMRCLCLRQRTICKAPVGRHRLKALVQKGFAMGVTDPVTLMPLHHPDGQVG